LARTFAMVDGKLGLGSTLTGYTPSPNGTYISMDPDTGWGNYLKNFSPNLDFSSWGWEEAPAKQNYQMLETPCVMWSFMDRYLLPYCPAPDVSIQDWWEVTSVGSTCGGNLDPSMPNVICDGDVISLSSYETAPSGTHTTDGAAATIAVTSSKAIELQTGVTSSAEWTVTYLDNDITGAWTTQRSVQLINAQERCALTMGGIANQGPVFNEQRTVQCVPCGACDGQGEPTPGSVLQVTVDPWSIKNSHGSEGWTVMAQYGLFPFTELAAQLAPMWANGISATLSQELPSECADVIADNTAADGGAWIASSLQEYDCEVVTSNIAYLFGLISLPMQLNGIGALVSRRANVAMISAMCNPPSNILKEESQFKDECKRLGISTKSWYSDYTMTSDLTDQDNLFDLSNLAVAVNLQNQNKLTKECPYLSVPKVQAKTQAIWKSSWGTGMQSQLRTDALNLMFAGRPAAAGFDWQTYMSDAGFFSLGLASFMRHPVFVAALYSMGEPRRNTVLTDATNKLHTLNQQIKTTTSSADSKAIAEVSATELNVVQQTIAMGHILSGSFSKSSVSKSSGSSAACAPVSSSTSDDGYTDDYRGWYDVSGCGKCNSFCRWVGDAGSGGNPATRVVSGSSFWSCRLAGGSETYSSSTYFKTFPYKKCSGEGATSPGGISSSTQEKFLSYAFEQKIAKMQDSDDAGFDEEDADQVKEMIENAGEKGETLTDMLVAAAGYKANSPGHISFASALWSGVEGNEGAPPAIYKSVMGKIGAATSMATFGFSVAALAMDHGKCPGVVQCIQTYATTARDGIEGISKVLEQTSTTFRKGAEAFEESQKTGGLLYKSAGFTKVKAAISGMMKDGEEEASDLIQDVTSSTSDEADTASNVGAMVSNAVKDGEDAVSTLGKVAKIFGTAVAALGVVADVVGVIMDGINAAAAFAKGGTWGDIDGVLDVVQGMACLAVIASTLLLGLTNPVTAIFSVIMLGVCLIAWLINLFKPKPLTGPQLVATALHYMGICQYTPPTAGCFPADAIVSVNNKGLPLSSLQLGMDVSTVSASGKIESTPVHFFGHKDHGALASFTRLVTHSGHSLSLTSDHLLPVAPAPGTPWANRIFKRSSSVKEGDYVWVNHEGSLELSEITGISSYTSRGLFNPYSKNGATLVNDVVASDHSAWILDPFISDINAQYAPAIYAPLLQTTLAYLYATAPTFVEAISECFYISEAAGTAWEDFVCAVSTTGSALKSGIASIFVSV